MHVSLAYLVRQGGRVLLLAGRYNPPRSSGRAVVGLTVCFPEFFGARVRLVGQLGQQKQV